MEDKLTLFGFTPLYYFSRATAMTKRINQRGDSAAQAQAAGFGFDQSQSLRRIPTWISFYFAQVPQLALKFPYRVEGFGVPTEFMIDPKSALNSQLGTQFGLFTLFKDSMPATVGTLNGQGSTANPFFMGDRATPQAVMSMVRKSMKDAVTTDKIRGDPLSQQLMSSKHIINGEFQGLVPDILTNLGRVAAYADDVHMQSVIDMAVGSSNDLEINKDRYYSNMIRYHLDEQMDSDAINPTVQSVRAAGRLIGNAMHLPNMPLMPFFRDRRAMTAEQIERESAALPVLRFNEKYKTQFVRDSHDTSRSRFAGELTSAQSQGLF